jgi:hypothetical protein
MAAEAGHNSKLTEDENSALFGYLVRKHREANDLRAEADAKDKDTFQKAKEWGVAKAAVQFFEKARKAGEGSSIIKKHAMHKEILIKLGYLQDDRGGDLLSDRVDKLQLHNRRGYSDGLGGEGGPGDSGFAANSDEDRAYMDGWKEGQRVYLDNWQTAMEKKIAAKSGVVKAPDDGDPFLENEDQA